MITSGGLVLSVGAIGEALSMMLVMMAIGVSATLLLYVLLKYSENGIQIELGGQDVIAALV